MGIMIIAVILGIIFAGILYIFNEKQHYGKTLTALLFIVRTIVIALLVLLFFNPFIKTKQNFMSIKLKKHNVTENYVRSEKLTYVTFFVFL